VTTAVQRLYNPHTTSNRPRRIASLCLMNVVRLLRRTHGSSFVTRGAVPRRCALTVASSWAPTWPVVGPLRVSRSMGRPSVLCAPAPVTPTCRSLVAPRWAHTNASTHINVPHRAFSTTTPPTQWALSINALCGACAAGNLRLVEMILRQDGDCASADENAPLVTAARHGHVDIVKTLLELPGVVASARGNRALTEAIEMGHYDVVATLLDETDVVEGENHHAALGLAVTLNRPEILSLLLSTLPVDMASEGLELLTAAVIHGHRRVLDLLLREMGGCDAHHLNMLLVGACSLNHDDVVQRLLREPGVDASDNGQMALFAACQGGHARVVKRLLATPGIDPTAFDWVALRVAVISSRSHDDPMAVVKLLLDDDRVVAGGGRDVAWEQAVASDCHDVCHWFFLQDW